MFQINVPQRVRSCLALAALPLLPMAGCAAVMGNLVKAEKAEQRSYSVSGQPSVNVDSFNGPITVKAASDGKVEAVVTKIGSGATTEAAQADLENVIVNYSQDGDTIRIVAKRTGPRVFGSSGASIELKVPSSTLLSLTTSNGAISATGITREITARSSNGEIDVTGVRGKLDLRTTNGAIKIGADEATVAAETTNGDIGFVGSLAKGSHKLESTNGGVDLKLPATAQFQFAASTSNGSVKNSFPGLQPKSGKVGGNRLAGVVGSGTDSGVMVELDTSNGGITIEPMPTAEAPKP
jgi:Putative adhesin